MKSIKLYINESKSDSKIRKIMGVYYFSSSNKENGYENAVDKSRKHLVDKIENVIKSHIANKNALDVKWPIKIDSQGFESSFEFTFVWPQDDADFFDNIDDVMDDLANLNDKSFIECFDEEGNYKTN